jgi:hypothetical protein
LVIIINWMVKIAKQSAQHTADPSFQMKVFYNTSID